MRERDRRDKASEKVRKVEFKAELEELTISKKNIFSTEPRGKESRWVFSDKFASSGQEAEAAPERKSILP